MNVFKSGDFVVFDNTIQYGKLLPNELMQYHSDHPLYESDAVVSMNGQLYEVSKKALRLARKDEEEAGHRIDVVLETGKVN
ncbi:TPA: hypothetical protein ACGIK9_003385 [Acinetobacter baumannii]|uniref:hypothetical protein n=1 Tax=Acinetobacter baumannii TaxID=470 RepID=UPI00338F9A1E